MNYDETDIAERYDAGRRLSDRALRLWLDEISLYVKPDEIRVILKYFPAALEYDRARLPSQAEIAATARGAGLSLLRHSVIEQEFASSMREYRDKVKMRALSDLAALSDAGIRRMENDSEQEVRSAIFEPIDLFIFQKVTSLEPDR